MGCGQSRMGMVYPRKWKNKAEKRKATEFHSIGRRSEKLSDADSDAEDPSTTELHLGGAGRANHDPCSASLNADWDGNGDGKCNESARNNRPTGGPGAILAQVELSGSQMDFFRMLDEKIALGKDYDSQEEEAEQEASNQRLVNSGRRAARGRLEDEESHPQHPVEHWEHQVWDNSMIQYHHQTWDQQAYYEQSPQHQHHYQLQQHQQNQQHHQLHQQQHRQRPPIYVHSPELNRSDIGIHYQDSPIRANGVSSHYESDQDYVDRATRPGRGGASAGGGGVGVGAADSDGRHHKSNASGGTNKDGRSGKSWFSETYSAWPLRRIGAALREDRSAGGAGYKSGGRNGDRPNKQRKTII